MHHDKFILKPGDIPLHSNSVQQNIIGKSAASLELRQMTELAAMANYPVLLTGKTGCGKENTARALHDASRLRAYQFMRLNCAQMSHDALAKAISDDAMIGIRFLHHVDHLSDELQALLIKRLDRDAISGHRKSRIVVATNACLSSMIDDGTFDRNLYYRLSLLHIPVPTLRQRKDDIPVLVDHFLMQMTKDTRFIPNQAAINALCEGEWLGNLRELRQVIARGAVFHAGQHVDVYQMRALIAMGQPHRRATKQKDDPVNTLQPQHFDLQSHLRNEEARFIQYALDASKGVVKHAAELSGMRRTTFVEKMRRHGITGINRS
jgi:sigma-54 dependent transcriptional regulator, flagellar regulatory protein